jgi:hypothetical protein
MAVEDEVTSGQPSQAPPFLAGHTLMPGVDMKQEFKSLSPVLAGSIDEHDSVQIDEAKLVRKIDLRVLPMLFIIYVAAFLDRCVCCSMRASLLLNQRTDVSFPQCQHLQRPHHEPAKGLGHDRPTT